MLTDRQISWVEEGLDQFQLIQRMDRAVEQRNWVGKRSCPKECPEATADQIGCWKLIYDYFDWLWIIACDVLQLKIRNQLEPLPPDEQKAKLRDWAREPEGSPKHRMQELYMHNRATAEIVNEIASYRADIAEQVLAIQDGLRVFEFYETSPFWPILGAGADETAANVTPVVDASSEPAQAASSGSDPAPSSAFGDDAAYIQLLVGGINIARSKKLKVIWKNVARQIVVGGPDHPNSLPTDSQDRIRERNFAGNLEDFIKLEDKERTKQIKKGVPPRDLIDFKSRFIHRFSDAKKVMGIGRRVQRRSNG